jgi:predicted site-specific integrase-resolvase
VDQESVTLQEAADRLGVSIDALRKRLKRGKLHGYQREGRWYVYLDGVDSTSTKPDNGQTTGQDEHRQPDTALVDVLRDQVATLKSQVAEQSAELDARRREVEELHILLQREQARTLPAPRESQSTNVDTDSSSTVVDTAQDVSNSPIGETIRRRPWWRWWG